MHPRNILVAALPENPVRSAQPSDKTYYYVMKESSCKTGGLRDTGTPTNAASLCHSTYTQK